MPSKVQVLNFLGILLQYGFLIVLYYFLVKVLQVIYRDLRPQKVNTKQVKDSNRFAFEHAPRLLVVQKGDMKQEQREFELEDSFSIGRGDHNDVSIHDSFVSMEHACITKYKQGYWLADLHSTNGTRVNGEKISGEVLLNSGDEIQIGSATFKFER